MASIDFPVGVALFALTNGTWQLSSVKKTCNIEAKTLKQVGQ